MHIREYLAATARKYGIDRHIRFDSYVRSADWDSATDTWTVTVEQDGARKLYRGRFLFSGEEEQGDFGDSKVVQWMRRRFRVTEELHGRKFAVRKVDPKTGRKALWFTPLALALVLVNAADVIFAVDSVPAIFAITTDTFVVYTSNIFAILGLRALYFALAAMVDRFAYLKTALAFILIFIGAKIVVADTFGLVEIPPWVSLVVTLVLLLGGVVYSLWRTRGEPKPEPQATLPEREARAHRA